MPPTDRKFSEQMVGARLFLPVHDAFHAVLEERGISMSQLLNEAAILHPDIKAKADLSEEFVFTFYGLRRKDK